jgi:hypothetical protein
MRFFNRLIFGAQPAVEAGEAPAITPPGSAEQH